jgi:predicted helicase
MSRIYGFEILPAPFVISHLQIGMLLHRLGAPFDDDSNERAGVYLTNALTGWDPPTEPKQHLLFTEMEEERDKAQAVKQHAPILVILGNPPYNIYAGAAIDEERDLVEAYRAAKRVAAPQGRGLNDLYVRFFRMAERRITEGAEGRGIVCFISNYSWLDGLSFTGMRERFLEVFDHIWVDCLNGDKYKTGKLTPDGEPDPSVFSTEKNREGIQVGTAITLMSRSSAHRSARKVSVRDFWGRDKKQRLVAALDDPTVLPYVSVVPRLPVGLPFIKAAANPSYLAWPRLNDLFPKSFPGLLTSRDDFVIDVDRDTLEARMRRYFDPTVDDATVAAEMPSAIADASRFSGVETRRYLLKRGMLATNIVRFAYRPFDNRWIYWEPETKLLHEKRSEYFPHVCSDNVWIEARQRQTMAGFDRGYVTTVLADSFGAGCSSFFPIYLRPSGSGVTLLDTANAEYIGNLAPASSQYLDQMQAAELDLFCHVAGIVHASDYRGENAGALRQDWPRIPLPATADALLASAELGRRVAALLDVESPVDGVSSGQIRFELRPIGSIDTIAAGGQIDPAAGDLAVTAGWGHAGQGGICMPAKGRLTERPYTDAELAGFREGLADLGLTYDQLMACLGGTCVDVFLNERAYWRCVPLRVWRYTIGGYQVMKKWLSYRECPLLGRDLQPEEARYVTEMARRIAALLLLEPALDANYERVKADTYEWAGSRDTPA